MIEIRELPELPDAKLRFVDVFFHEISWHNPQIFVSLTHASQMYLRVILTTAETKTRLDVSWHSLWLNFPALQDWLQCADVVKLIDENGNERFLKNRFGPG